MNHNTIEETLNKSPYMYAKIDNKYIKRLSIIAVVITALEENKLNWEVVLKDTDEDIEYVVNLKQKDMQSFVAPITDTSYLLEETDYPVEETNYKIITHVYSNIKFASNSL
jgi:hypothetical protein